MQLAKKHVLMIYWKIASEMSPWYSIHTTMSLAGSDHQPHDSVSPVPIGLECHDFAQGLDDFCTISVQKSSF